MFSIEWRNNSGGYGRRRSLAKALPQGIVGGPALACVALAFACAWFLWTHVAGTGADQVLDVQPRLSTNSNAYAKLANALNAYAKLSAGLNAYARRSAALISYAALFDSRHSLGFAPGTFARSADIQADGQPAAPPLRLSTNELTQEIASAPRGAAPAPRLRLPPTGTASLRDTEASRAVADTGADQPTIFERLFGKPSPLTLAYAAPDDGGLGGQSVTSGRYDRWTAVYDISAHTVYLPDGTRLEAHSGLGSRLDDPRHADERMRGPTPPNVYDLQLREAPFHGVRALRLIPVDDEKVFGRTGLLAHTYMLGPNGQSFGCVSFRNYNAFLQAYMKHEIKRLVVVSRLD